MSYKCILRAFLFLLCVQSNYLHRAFASESRGAFNAKPELSDLSEVITQMKQPDGWETAFEGDGIKGYKKQVPGSSIYAVKGYGEVDGSFDQVASVIIDEEHSTEWIQDLVESKSVGGNFPADYIEFNQIGTPFIVHDREFLNRVRMKVDPKHQVVAYFYGPTDFSYPEHPPRVRGELTYTVIAVMPVLGSNPQKSLVLAEFHGDPKGAIPKWLVNWFQSSWPKDTLSALRKQLARRKVGIHPVISTALKNKGPSK